MRSFRSCEFWLQASRFPLGHSVISDGIIMDPSKVEAINKWTRPYYGDGESFRDLEHLDVELCVRGSGGYWGSNEDKSNLMLQIKETQRDDDRLCVPKDQAPIPREGFMTEAHSSPFTIHPGSTKMYKDLKQYFWWNNMKQDVATFVSKCMTCQQDKHTSANDGPSPEGRTIQTLEDMLRACALEWTGSWDEYLCLVEFAYNNSWHASIKAAPFELLYGRKCRAPICWDEVGERLIEGPELIEITNEKVAVAKEKLKEARSRQKSYADKHRRDLEFQVGDRVFLKVSPFRRVKRFRIKGKLSPRFIGPFEILERIGEVSYRLALPPQLSHVHDVFHVSLLRGYHYHPLHVASYPFDQIQPDMSLSEEPESILDRQERVMRNKVIPFVKILWKNHPEREATWETEESMRASYPHFFV
ncbi:putative nucleotidyltransferase, ribonuclease H [Tanacetum coccineum]|uniref:Nucleotidyltransferase, ribonuclease H n=1 Tax=Tanacetum coccineum TaxID=301880 RepID=A0ABQ5BN67_9ASTR